MSDEFLEHRLQIPEPSIKRSQEAVVVGELSCRGIAGRAHARIKRGYRFYDALNLLGCSAVYS